MNKCIMDMTSLGYYYKVSSVYVDLDNVGRAHGVSPTQWCNSMANSNSIKVIERIFKLAFTVFEILPFQIVGFENLG